MAVGRKRHYKIDEILARHWQETADAARLPRTMCARVIEEIQDTVDSATDSVAGQLPSGFPEKIYDMIRAAIRSRTSRLESVD